MNPDERRRDEAPPERSGDGRAESDDTRDSYSHGGALGTPVVLVADRDPAVTDRIAAVLRDSYTVRSAYDSADALASLDPDVSVALLDPDIPGLTVQRVLSRVKRDGEDCQIAALTDEALDLGTTDFDDYLVKPVSADHLRETVDRLSRRATYRTTLERYYETARERAQATDPERCTDLDRQLSELNDRLDEVFGGLGGDEAYDAALRELDPDP